MLQFVAFGRSSAGTTAVGRNAACGLARSPVRATVFPMKLLAVSVPNFDGCKGEFRGCPRAKEVVWHIAEAHSCLDQSMTGAIFMGLKHMSRIEAYGRGKSVG